MVTCIVLCRNSQLQVLPPTPSAVVGVAPNLVKAETVNYLQCPIGQLYTLSIHLNISYIVLKHSGYIDLRELVF